MSSLYSFWNIGFTYLDILAWDNAKEDKKEKEIFVLSTSWTVDYTNQESTIKNESHSISATVDQSVSIFENHRLNPCDSVKINERITKRITLPYCAQNSDYWNINPIFKSNYSWAGSCKKEVSLSFQRLFKKSVYELFFSLF